MYIWKAFTMHEGQRSHRKNGQNFNGKINIQKT